MTGTLLSYGAMGVAMVEAVGTVDGPGAGRRPHGRQAVAFITVVSLLNSIAAMMILPVLPRLVEGFTHQTSGAAVYIGSFAAAFGLIQFLASPVLGSLSDAYGRRTVILISASGMAVDYLFMALAPSVGWLFVGRMISGLTASSGPAVNAYIADVIPPEERAGVFGWTGAAFSVGFLVGPALGGFLGVIDPRLPFWASAAIGLAVALYGLFVLPESLPRERRTPFSFRRANPWGSFRFLAERPQILGLVVVLSMMFMAAQCLPTTLPLFTEHRFHWSTAAVGAYLSYASVGHLVVQGLVVKRFVAKFGERVAAVTGYAATAAGFLIYATAPTGPLFAMGMPLYALAGLVGPSVQSQLTRSVAPTEQGRLQGAVAGVSSLIGVVAAMTFPLIFSFTAAKGHEGWPQGLHIYVAAAILICGAILAFRIMRRSPASVAASAA